MEREYLLNNNAQVPSKLVFLIVSRGVVREISCGVFEVLDRACGIGVRELVDVPLVHHVADGVTEVEGGASLRGEATEVDEHELELALSVEVEKDEDDVTHELPE